MSFKVIRVTLTEDYILDTKYLDGRPAEEVAKEWFEDHGLSRHHAARDACLVGNSRTLVSYGDADGPPKTIVVPSEGQRVIYDPGSGALHLEATFVHAVEGWYQLSFADGSMGIVRPSRVRLP